MMKRYTEEDRIKALRTTINRLERLADPKAQRALDLLRQFTCSNVTWTAAAVQVRFLRNELNLYSHDFIWAFLPFAMRANDIYFGRLPTR